MPFAYEPPSYWGSLVPEHWTKGSIFTWMLKDDELKYKTLSQCGQDLIINSLIIEKSPRLFLDLGANNGIDLSSTYLLEKLGWSGLLVEPNIELMGTLTSNRTSDILAAAVAPEHDITILSTSDLHTLGTLSDNTNSYQIERLIRETKGGKDSLRYKLVPSIPFSSLIKKFVKFYGSKPNFLKIDIEGMEEYVLSALCDQKILPDVVEVENNLRTSSWSNIMSRSGYECKIVMDSFVEIWVHSSIIVPPLHNFIHSLVSNSPELP